MRGVRIAYATLFVFLTFGHVATFMFRRSLPEWFTGFASIVGPTWMVAVLYLFMAILLIDLLRLANHWLHFFPSWITVSYAKTKLITLFSVIGVAVLIVSWGYYKFTHPVINELEVRVHKPAPGDKKELRIVMASDLHLGNVIGKNRLAKFVELINAQNPDIILFSGDVVDGDIRPVIANNMHEELLQLQAPMGIYGVLGNHEYIGTRMGGRVDTTITYLRNSGIQLLRDEVLNVGDNLTIVGRDDKANRNRKKIHELTDSLDKQRAIILLDHQPYHLEQPEECGVDLALYGHTHNGQIWPLSCIIGRMYEVAQGYKQKGNTHIYVSAGLGLWGPPFRIGTESELLVVTLIFD
jgi:predicted MPP superfamily phosphohydrolase